MGNMTVRRRGLVGVAAVFAAVGITAGTLTATPLAPVASAAPASTADDLLAHYKELSVEAERTAEAMNAAQAQFDEQQGIVVRETRAAAAAVQALDRLAGEQEEAQQHVDAVVRASYKGARVNRLYAMMVSDSPQDLLDSMSDLELLSTQASRDLRDLRQAQRQLSQEEARADQARSNAVAARDQAAQARRELQAKTADMQLEEVKVRAVYQALTGKQLAALIGPKYDFDPASLPRGTAPELVAVHAALSKIGSPYVWGAVGPSSFDCSGLMVWAYKQAGKTIPRTSEAQQGGGTAVAREDLRPGDLIIYYPDAHHVGMYVGEGYVIHASTFGVPVAVVPLEKAGPFNSARRY